MQAVAMDPALLQSEAVFVAFIVCRTMSCCKRGSLLLIRRSVDATRGCRRASRHF
jgi:hypothetical protein